jgi:hypothetical protein
MPADIKAIKIIVGIISMADGVIKSIPMGAIPIKDGWNENIKNDKIIKKTRITLFGLGKARDVMMAHAVYIYTLTINKSSNIYTAKMAAINPAARQIPRI